MEKLKILIVEDEVLVAFQLQMGLRRVGYHVYDLVASGDEAIESAKKEAPDVVVIDISLPGVMDGIEVARRIGAFSSARIIFTTGHQDTNLKERAMRVNPIAYLSKPVGWRDIDTAIRSSQATPKDPE